ncbi:MAG: 16S rRNA (uracil(1498)-N(3))-methyltransferase [Candidatus Hydrogenedentes bacterium]|nr:16S rRNA (uracil(1498)-N(3))-methyltransferase [Candidatus Hydrogenedentota bacterium]
MPHIHRFFARPDELDKGTITLRDEEAHHALHVTRVRQGDTVVAFDGRGQSWQGEVVSTTRHEVVVRVQEERTAPPPATRVTLLQAWLHREKPVEELIRRGTELGVSRFVFFPSAHSERKPQITAKWARWAVESCKQCGRLWLPELWVVADLGAALKEAQGPTIVATRDAPPRPLRSALHGAAATLLVGPEGDFEAAEIRQALEAGAVPISLGEAVYRSEVAATLAISLIQYELGKLGPLPE